MTQIFVFPAGDDAAQLNLRRSIETPIRKEKILSHFREVDPQELRRLERVHRDGGGFYAWGTKPSDDERNEGAWEAMEEGDYVLAYYKGAYRYVSILLAKYDEPELARAIWEDPGGEMDVDAQGSIENFIDGLLDSREDGTDGSTISVPTTVSKPLRPYEDYTREEVH